jgi:hypothetical protein
MVVYKDPKEKSYDEKTIRMKYLLNYLWQEKKDVIDSLKTNEDEKGCAIVLYAAKITKQKGKQRLDQIKTLVKAISWNGDDPPDEDYCHGLQEFCAFLHPNIATPSITPYAHIPTLSPKEFQAHALYTPTPLLASLFGLATGLSRVNKADIEEKQDYQSQFLAIAAAQDLLLYCATVRNPCHLQLMIGNQIICPVH